MAPIKKLILQPDTIVRFAEFHLILLYAIVQNSIKRTYFLNEASLLAQIRCIIIASF